MKQRVKFFSIVVFICSILIGVSSHAQETVPEDKTLSPYFFVKSGEPNLDRMPLKSTKAKVNIIGVIADVTVTQVYKNEGNKPLEAVYIFPASTRAAVYGMKMTIGKRVIEAKIKKRGDARQEYEDAKKHGKSASLLEQQRPNVFQMNVANILPSDIIAVELRYTELMVPADKTYEFIYPTVVGPRYSSQSAAAAPASEKWVENPHLHQGEAPAYTFDVRVDISTGLPLRQLACGSHKVNVSYDSPSRAMVSLDKAESWGGNRDYILRYQLTGDRIESGLLLSDGGSEKFFLLMMQPPKKISQAEIPGREYIFIVDVSGSMYGFPLDISKRLFRDLITNLQPADRFNVLLFSGGSAVLAEKFLTATPDNVKKGIAFIDRQQGGGGTELLSALKRALSLPQSEGYARTVVIATDGYVTVEEEVFDLIRQNLNRANMFTFGIGTSVNRHLLEGMARVGMGEPFVITKADEAPARAEAFRSMIQSPLLSHITVDYNGFDAYDIEPVTAPDVLSERPVIIFGKWRGKTAGKIMIRGTTGSGIFKEVIDVARSSPSKNNAALRYLWARHRIALLSDYNKLRPDDKRIQEVTSLGLSYNLLTAYTSFIAVDNEVRNRSKGQSTVRQPLPMPEGVSDFALPGNAGQASRKSVFNSAAESVPGVLSPQPKKAGGSKDETKSGEIAASQMTVADISVTGGLSKDAAKIILEQHLSEIKNCSGKTGLHGKVVIEVTVNALGDVTRTRIISGRLTDRDAEQCILRQIRNWKFSPAGGAIAGTIRFSLIF